ncbi:MAG: stage II sporulation protein R [Mycoplasmatota bacterium]
MKTILLLCLVVFTFVGISNEDVLIPDDALRLRIVANSNTEYDQDIKEEVKESVESTLYTLLSSSTSLEQSRQIVNNNLSVIEKNITDIFNEYNYDETFSINYGLNYFPQKEYEGVIYDEGNYESLLITLGSGEGDNWWCVLYPPLCMIEQTDEDVEYKSLVMEILEQFN